MKGKTCSWRDIRRINHILENAGRLKGEMAALTNCVDRTTLRGWKRVMEVLAVLDIQHDFGHVASSHADEIARHAPKECWPEWVESCEKNKWTVAQLRIFRSIFQPKRPTLSP